MNKQVLGRRRKVAKYLRNIDISPLMFEGYTSNKGEFDISKYSIQSMIERALDLSYRYNSINIRTGLVETYGGRYRSIIDIWRHIRYYYPRISIFEVMRNVKMVDGLIGHYCPNIRRYVMQTIENKPFTRLNDSRSEFGFFFHLYDEV